jgi:hypothetical protein
MLPTQIVQQMMNRTEAADSKAIVIKTGQIFRGQIGKIFPNNLAIVKFGGMQMHAKLEAPLSSNNNYWFKVMSKEGMVNLKVIEPPKQGSHLDPSQQLMQQMGLPNQKNSKEIVSYFLKQKTPFTKENLVLASKWLSDNENKRVALKTIDTMIQKDLPFTKTVLDSLLAVQQKTSITDELKQLLQSLQTISKPSADIQKLVHGIERLLGERNLMSSQTDIQNPIELENNLKQLDSSRIATSLKQMISSIGFEFEAMFSKKEGEQKTVQSDLLKPLLLQILNEDVSPSIHDKISHLVHRITGQQILSMEQPGPMQNIFIQIPIEILNHKTDLTMQWNGHKKEDGTIDPSFCRIIFHLNLKQLADTMLDVQIQKRVVSIQLFNDTPGLADKVKNLKTFLSEGLLKHEYKLSSVTVKSFHSNEHKPTLHPYQRGTQSYEGVDFRI